MNLRMVQTEWPGGFKDGDAVRYRGRAGHVTSSPPGFISKGHIPVMYDVMYKDEVGCVVAVPSDELSHLFNLYPRFEVILRQLLRR